MHYVVTLTISQAQQNEKTKWFQEDSKLPQQMLVHHWLLHVDIIRRLSEQRMEWAMLVMAFTLSLPPPMPLPPPPPSPPLPLSLSSSLPKPLIAHGITHALFWGWKTCHIGIFTVAQATGPWNVFQVPKLFFGLSGIWTHSPSEATLPALHCPR